jgi:hypothetical protein
MKNSNRSNYICEDEQTRRLVDSWYRETPVNEGEDYMDDYYQFQNAELINACLTKGVIHGIKL